MGEIQQRGREADGEAVRNVIRAAPNAALPLLGELWTEQAKLTEASFAPRQPIFHDSAFKIALPTPQGIVGLWSSWLRDKLFIGYPASAAKISEKIIIAELEKPIGSEPSHSRALERRGMSLAGVPIVHSANSVGMVSFTALDSNGRTTDSHYGNRYGQCIRTAEAHETQLKVTESSVQRLRDGFLNLTAAIANELGGAASVSIHFSMDVVPPQQLEMSGFRDLKRDESVTNWGEVAVTARRSEQLVGLRLGNSSFPWTPIVRTPLSGDVTGERLKELLTF